MARKRHSQISASELAARKRRVIRIARRMGFVGTVEYLHLQSRSGGAQYGRAVDVERDRLTVFAEAFEKDADPEEFSLEAIIAHERGPQLLAQHPTLRRSLPAVWSDRSDEIAASLLGSLLVWDDRDRENLIAKATYDALGYGSDLAGVMHRVRELRILLEDIL